MDRIKKLKIKKQDGTFSDYIPIGADAENVDTTDGESVELKLNKKPYYYNSIANMKADTKLKVGDMAITLGYYEANDGGGAEYRIINGNYTDDGGSYHELENNLWAELIFKDMKVNVKKFGAKGDDSFDNTNIFNNCIDYCNVNKMDLYFPFGKYRVYNQLHQFTRTVSMIGEKGNSAVGYDGHESIIRDYRDAETEDYLFYYPPMSTAKLGTSIYDLTFTGVRSRNNNCIKIACPGYKSIIDNVVFVGFEHALFLDNNFDTLLENVACYNCGGRADNSNAYAITIQNIVSITLDKCLIEHSRWMIDASSAVSSLIIKDSHFEIVDNIGYLGESPIRVEKGLIYGNTFCNRPFEAIVEEAQLSDPNDAYYFLQIGSGTKLINNSFSEGGPNDGTTPNYKRQTRYLKCESNCYNTIISHNSFVYAAFDIPSILIKWGTSNVIFSDNVVTIDIEESLDSTVMNKYIIDDSLIKIEGNNNLYTLYTTNTSIKSYNYIPAFSNSHKLLYAMTSLHKGTSNNTSYDIYNFVKSGLNYTSTYIPTLKLQGTSGLFELEVQSKDGKLYYKGMIYFKINGSNTTVTEHPIVNVLGSASLNFIKDTDKLIIQLTNATNYLDSLIFRINKSTQDCGFIYQDRRETELTTNIIKTISETTPSL